MFKDFMTTEMITTFGGLTTAVIVFVQFTKFIVKKKLGDSFVRPYAFLVALVLTFVFHKEGKGLEGLFLTVLNSMMITIASMGGYELLADPRAKRVKV